MIAGGKPEAVKYVRRLIVENPVVCDELVDESVKAEMLFARRVPAPCSTLVNNKYHYYVKITLSEYEYIIPTKNHHDFAT